MTAPTAPGAEPISVAFVLPGLGVVPRGAEAFVGDLVRSLSTLPSRPDRPGFEITVFCRGTPDLESSAANIVGETGGGIGSPSLPRIERIRALARDSRWLQRGYRATRLGRKILDTLFLDPLSWELYTAALSALPGLLRGRFDVVVMEGGLVGSWVARWVRRRRGSAFVDIAHGLDPKWEGAFARQKPDRTVTFTRHAAKMLASLAPDAALEVIPHGIDLDRFHPAVAKPVLDLPSPVVLAVGSVDTHKRMHLTVEAVAELTAHPGRAASLLVLGDGPEAAALDRLASQRLPPESYRRRSVTRDELPGYYAAADVFTLPSVSESFGLVYVEALACGTPVVAPDDPVRREILGEPKTGNEGDEKAGAIASILCDPTSPTDYARALEDALHRDWGPLPGNDPRRRAERFPFAATVEAYARLFRELSGGGTSGDPTTS